MEILKNTGIETVIKQNSYSIEIGGMSEPQLESALGKKPFVLADYARDMMQSLDFSTFAKSREIRVAKLRLFDLGFTGYPTTAQILKQASKLGLELLPAEAGPHARLQDRDQRSGDWYYIVINPIAGRDGDPDEFRVARDGDGLWLGSRWTGPGAHWYLDETFVFGLRK